MRTTTPRALTKFLWRFGWVCLLLVAGAVTYVGLLISGR